MPASSRLARASAALAVVVLSLAGCSSSAEAPPVATVSPQSSFSELPSSSLPTMEGITYRDSADAQAALSRTHVGTTLSAFSGGISRDLVVDGRTVGGLQVYRFASDVPQADYPRFPPMMLYTDTGAAPSQQQLGGKTIQVVDPAPESGRAVVAWALEDEVMILWADDLETAKEYASRCILATV